MASITSKREMWEFIRSRNPALAGEAVTLPVQQLERLVGVVWDTAVKSVKIGDLPDFLHGMLRK